MSECTIYLHAAVESWFCERIIAPQPGSYEDELICLQGEVSHPSYIDQMPFDFRIVCREDNLSPENGEELNSLIWHEALPEYGLPLALSTLLQFSSGQFAALRSDLLTAAGSERMRVSLSAEISGLEKVDDRITHAPNQAQVIERFSWQISLSPAIRTEGAPAC